MTMITAVTNYTKFDAKYLMTNQLFLDLNHQQYQLTSRMYARTPE